MVMEHERTSLEEERKEIERKEVLLKKDNIAAERSNTGFTLTFNCECSLPRYI